MIESFKNIERLRYRLSSDMEKMLSENKVKTEDMKEQISNTIFAAIFSAFITEVALGGNEENYAIGIDIAIIMLKILIFIIIYILSYKAYNFLRIKGNKWSELRKLNSVDTGKESMTQIQKDFDNIACDSILVAREYKNLFEDLTNNAENKNLRTFYYYEVLHYLSTACKKTVDLVENKEKCVRTSQKAKGVDEYRIINIKDIMEEIRDFLQSEFANICGGTIFEEDIKYQFEQITKEIEYVKTHTLQ